MSVRIPGVRRGGDGGYTVLDGHNDIVGRVLPKYAPSHIRRGRMQASPWWQAVDLDGQPVGQMHQRRIDAAVELDR